MKKLMIIMCSILMLLLCGCSKKAEDINKEIKENVQEDTTMKCNNMSYKEIADIFKEMGIAELSDEEIKKIEEQCQWPGYGEDAFMNKAANMLIFIGSGNYNYETRKWTPTSDKVYCFDAEVYDVDHMYTLFLQGISSINNGEFKITNINEDTEKVNYEEGNGTQKISFCYNDHSYSFDASVDNDWFDGNIINYMNDVFEKEGNPKRLYGMTDGYQECIIFYCTSEWADTFNEKLGCKLE